MDKTEEKINLYEDIGKPYFHKIEDNEYITYVSFDDKYKTVYNKKTHDIYYISQRESGSNRFKKDYVIPK